MMLAHGIPRSSRGFTLLEVLMVVLVVGILSAMVLLGLNPGGAERHLNDEAERLASLLSLAGSEAVMQNREYGLQFDDNGYRFLCMDNATQRWSLCEGDSLFKEHELPDGLEIRVIASSRMQIPEATISRAEMHQAKPSVAGEAADLQPDILLLSSGEASPGELEIRVTDDSSKRIKVVLDEIGRVRWGDQIDEAQNNAG